MDLKTFADNVGQMRRFQQLMQYGATPGLVALKNHYEKLVDDTLNENQQPQDQEKTNYFSAKI